MDNGELVPITALLHAHPPDRHPALVYLAGLAPGSRRTQASALNWIAGHMSAGACGLVELPWELIRYPHAAKLASDLVEQGRAPATVGRMLSALRGVLEQAWKLDLMSAEELQRAKSVRNPRGSRLLAGRMVTPEERAALLAAAGQGRHATIRARDRALIAVFFLSGLRREELAGLELDACDSGRGDLRILGKGNKERTGYISEDGRGLVRRWLALRGWSPGPLLMPVDKRGVIQRRRMSADAIYRRLKHLGELAGVECSPHDLRRTWISNLLDAGADLATVQALAGHANPGTTARYDRRGERAKRKAADLLSLA